jgi:hypothetical protein
MQLIDRIAHEVDDVIVTFEFCSASGPDPDRLVVTVTTAAGATYTASFSYSSIWATWPALGHVPEMLKAAARSRPSVSNESGHMYISIPFAALGIGREICFTVPMSAT